MRKMILAAGFAVLIAAPSIASAQQTYCERSNSNRAVTGTVIGGVAGALLGSAIAGNSSNTAGTVVGGVAGAVAGNQIAKSGNQPCPQGYVESYNNAPAYAPVQASPYAYREYGPAYGGQYDSNRFWQGAPSAPEQRINFLIDRVNQGRADGSLTRGEARRVMTRIDDVQREVNRLRRQDRGQLSGRNQNYIQTRLDDISRQIAWQRTNYNNDRGGYNRR